MMLVEITNTTDHKFIGQTIKFDGAIDDLYLTPERSIELIAVVKNDDNTIKFISDNYIVDGKIVEN